MQLAIIAGFVWTLGDGYLHEKSINTSVVIKPVALIEGKVDNLVSSKLDYKRYFITVIKINNEHLSPLTVLIKCYLDCPELRAGETWQLLVKLQPPSSRYNPDSFDTERWLFSQEVAATGYLVNSRRNIKLSDSTGIAGYRSDLKDKLATNFTDDLVFSSLVALLLGDRSELSDEQIKHLSESGLSHLVAISGLHVSLAMFPGMLLGASVWYLGIGRTGISRQSLQWLGASATAFSFSMIAGFGIPAQRALIMALALSLIHFIGKPSSSIQRLSLTLTIILVLQPRATLALSFWLSFIITCLIVWGTNVRINYKTWNLIYLQCFLALFIYILQLFVFGKYSLASLIHNLWAIPYISLVLLPMALFWIVLEVILTITCLEIINDILGFLVYYFWYLLNLTSSVTSSLVLSHFNDVLLTILVLIVSLVTWFVRSLKSRITGIIMLCLLGRQTITDDSLILTALDVGQGTAIVISTSRQLILYDTGYGNQDYQAITSVLPQWMHRRGIDKIDSLIISHSDADHRGGFGWLTNNINISSIISNEDFNTPASTTHRKCEKGKQLQMGQLIIELLWPAFNYLDNNLQTSNDDSCVVLIKYGGRKILLTGDIGKAVENKLLTDYPDLTVDILSVPHHGSDTSSSHALLAHLKPEIALNTSGYLNRFGFPHKDVVSRYQQHGIQFYDTASAGAIEITITKSGEIILRLSRQQNPALWRRN